MKKIFGVIIALFFLFGFQPVSGQTLQNYEVFPSEGNFVVRGVVDLKNHFQSADASVAIQWSVNHLTSGGQVFLHKGNYQLKKEISLPSYVTLKGSEMGSVLVVDPAHETGNTFNIIGSNRVVLKDFLIKSVKEDNQSKNGIVLSNCGDCVVDGVYIVGMKENGVYLNDDTFLCEVKNCRIAACAESAIKLHNLAGGGRGGDFVPNHVSNCIIFQGGYGVFCSNAIVANISGVTVYQSQRNAFYLNQTSNSVLITGCRSYQCQDDAVVIENSHEINISSNIFCWTEGNGIVLNGVKWGTVSANNVIDCGSINPFERDKDSLIVRGPREFRRMPRTPQDRESVKSGIVIQNETKGVTVTGNALFNWPAAPKMKYGIVEDATCVNNIISSNNVNTYEKAEVFSEGKDTKVLGNVGYGEVPYTGKIGITELQYFDLRLMENFIDEIWN